MAPMQRLGSISLRIRARLLVHRTEDSQDESGRRKGYADAVEGRPRMDVCRDYVVVARDVKTGSSGVEKAGSPTYRERTVFEPLATLYIVVE